jgi:hypothetical protein
MSPGFLAENATAGDTIGSTMKRFLLLIVAGISFLLSVWAAVFMVRSLFMRDLATLEWQRGDVRYSVGFDSWRGSAAVTWIERFRLPDESDAAWLAGDSSPQVGHWSYPRGSPAELSVLYVSNLKWHFGFGSGRFRAMTAPGGNGVATTVGTMRVYAVPWWCIAILTAMLPTFALLRWRSIRRRHRTGLCMHCGYDLRATPDRCPECGTVNTSRLKPA